MNVTIIKQTEMWNADALPIEFTIRQVFSHLALEATSDIAVVLTDNAYIQTLNHQFRGKDKPTNVLSFPSEVEEELGDLLFAYETLQKESLEQSKSFEHHFTHLLVHGTLHLLGYDHEDDAEAREMESLEIAILAQLGIENPYEKE